MACNCATQKQLDDLYRMFGERNKPTGRQTLAFWTKYYLIKAAVMLTMLVISPILLLYIIYVTFWGDRKIRVSKFFDLKEMQIGDYVGNEQNIQNPY